MHVQDNHFDLNDFDFECMSEILRRKFFTIVLPLMVWPIDIVPSNAKGLRMASLNPFTF
jgi:hypothetical protein